MAFTTHLRTSREAEREMLNTLALAETDSTSGRPHEEERERDFERERDAERDRECTQE